MRRVLWLLAAASTAGTATAEAQQREAPHPPGSKPSLWWTTPSEQLREQTDRCNDKALVPCDYWAFKTLAQAVRSW